MGESTNSCVGRGRQGSQAALDCGHRRENHLKQKRSSEIHHA